MERRQLELVKLIQKYCRASQRVYPVSSYGLKSLFERLAGCYITQTEMVAAMSAAGFEAKDGKYKLKVVDLPEIPSEYLTAIERYRRTKNGRV